MTLQQQHQKMLDYAQGRPLQSQLNAVNMFWNNHINYTPDEVAWAHKIKQEYQDEMRKKTDYWPAIWEIYEQEHERGIAMGDCTTYTCGKSESLTLLGRKPFIVIGEINGMSHAWVECSNYILDNPPNRVLKHKNDRWDLTAYAKLGEQNIITRRDILPVTRHKAWAQLLQKRTTEGQIA